MPFLIPTLEDLYNAHLARLESTLGQDAPINDKAFLRVLAMTEAGLDIGLYKLSANNALQCLAISATGSGLDDIGNQYDTPRKTAVPAILEAELSAMNGTIIPATQDFISDTNGLRYRPTESVTAAAGVAVLNLRCVETGASGNMETGETFSISAQISGADTVATVTSSIQTGAEDESDTNYRPRVLFAIRSVTGGANATDHKIWAEAVAGVRRAFPYAGRPASEGVSQPGDRLIYIEADSSVDSDGIAPLSLLNSVRDAINTDPATGDSRMVLGLTDDTLFIESIIRTGIYVTVSSLSVDPADEADLKSDLSEALDSYFRSIAPFVDGVDVEIERTDSITTPSVGNIAQDVFQSYGASAELVVFGLVPGVFVNLYFLPPGELAKLAGVTYV